MTIQSLNCKINKFLKIVMEDPNRKNLIKIFYEYINFLLFNRSIAEQYFSKYMYHREINNFSHYYLNKKSETKCWNLNSKIYTSLLDNKRIFETFFVNHGINVVRSLAYNNNSLFFYKDKLIQITTYDEFFKFISKLLDEKTGLESIFTKKTDNSYGGSNIFKLSLSDFSSDIKKTYKLFNKVIKSNYLFQETIVQHKIMNQLNPACINTIRIDTYTNTIKNSKVLSSFLRTGLNNSCVDNLCNGGVCVGINDENGTLKSEAYSIFEIGKGLIYKDHPQTGTKFKGFEIPYYQESKKLAIEAARLVPQLKIVGWDIAIQPDGPILIEGNSRPGLYFSEMVQKGFLKNPVFRDLLGEINR